VYRWRNLLPFCQYFKISSCYYSFILLSNFLNNLFPSCIDVGNDIIQSLKYRCHVTDEMRTCSQTFLNKNTTVPPDQFFKSNVFVFLKIVKIVGFFLIFSSTTLKHIFLQPISVIFQAENGSFSIFMLIILDVKSKN
jgi:hypothetical protein